MRSVLIAMLIAMASVAQGQESGAGIVNLVAGNVRYTPGLGNEGKVQAFMKVYEGDRIDLPAGGQLSILYLASGRRERWAGPAAFRVGRSAADPISGIAANASTLPPGASQRIAQIPGLVRLARLGGVQVRGLTRTQETSLAQQEAVAKARVTYQSMRSELAEDDISPELYLFAALYEYVLYDDMKPVAVEMQRRQPENDDLKSLEAWVRARATH